MSLSCGKISPEGIFLLEHVLLQKGKMINIKHADVYLIALKNESDTFSKGGKILI